MSFSGSIPRIILKKPATAISDSNAKLLALTAIVHKTNVPLNSFSAIMLKLRFTPFAAMALSTAIVLAQDAAPAPDAKPDAAAPQSIPRADATEPAPADAAPATPAPVRKRRVIAKATPVPVATPVPRKLGFWERLFGSKKSKPAPATPTPAPTPKPAVTKRTAVNPRPQKPDVAAPTPPATATKRQKTGPAKVEPKKSAEPIEEKMPPTKIEEKPKATPKGGKPRQAPERAQNFPPSTDNADAEVVEKQKYDQAKSKAVADPKLQELRGKADLAASDEESRKALRAYNKAMFKRMKEIDPSIADHVDRMEAAVLKRLGE